MSNSTRQFRSMTAVHVIFFFFFHIYQHAHNEFIITSGSEYPDVSERGHSHLKTSSLAMLTQPLLSTRLTYLWLCPLPRNETKGLLFWTIDVVILQYLKCYCAATIVPIGRNWTSVHDLQWECLKRPKWIVSFCLMFVFGMKETSWKALL